MRIREDAFGLDSADFAETANDLAMLLRDLRRMDEARGLALDPSLQQRWARLCALACIGRGLFKCRDKRPSCSQQWFSVNSVDRLPIGNRLR